MAAKRHRQHLALASSPTPSPAAFPPVSPRPHRPNDPEFRAALREWSGEPPPLLQAPPSPHRLRPPPPELPGRGGAGGGACEEEEETALRQAAALPGAGGEDARLTGDTRLPSPGVSPTMARPRSPSPPPHPTAALMAPAAAATLELPERAVVGGESMEDRARDEGGGPWRRRVRDALPSILCV